MFSMESSVPSEIKQFTVTEVPAGSTAALNCHSNDVDHNFMFWLFNGTDVIGPGNDFNERKYKYNVLTGKLYIHNVSPRESGYYHCISRRLNDDGYAVGQVDMVVSGSIFTPIDAVKISAIVVSILVLIVCALLYYKMRKDWRRYEGRVIVPVDDAEEDQDDGDEIYNRTTTPTQARQVSQPAPGPSRNVSSEHLLYGIDNQGLDTDFNSVFENIQIKSPPASLI